MQGWHKFSASLIVVNTFSAYTDNWKLVINHSDVLIVIDLTKETVYQQSDRVKSTFMFF